MVQICFEPIGVAGSKRITKMAVSSTNKKVIVVRFEREPVAGVVNPGVFGDPGPVEILTGTGNLVRASFEEIKAICFVKELPAGSRVPEEEAWQANRLFAVRPKSGGLWLRFKFRDLDSLDGVAPNNLLAFEAMGFTVVPPDPSFLNQRIFVPRAALIEAQVMGVIGSPLRLPAGRKPKPKSPDQIELFQE